MHATMSVQVAICCFDKTGTLTSDNMKLEGLSGVPGAGEGLLKEVRDAPRDTQRVLACCQALIQVDGELVGDPLERAAFEAVGEALLATHFDALHCRLQPGNRPPSRMCALECTRWVTAASIRGPSM